MNNEYEVILCIVNTGFSEVVMETVRECGASGGTVINARGTARKEAEKIFNIVIHPEKEIVLVLIPKQIKESVLHSLYKAVGLNTPGQGIAFALPVDDVVGLTPIQSKKDEK